MKTVLQHIKKHSGCISASMLAADLRLTDKTVARVVRFLEEMGLVCKGWDGNALELTDYACRLDSLGLLESEVKGVSQ